MLIRFPYVSSSIPTTPLNRTPSKRMSRARTAPPLQLKEELPIKSAEVVQTNLQPIIENIETTITEPTKVDVQRDIQILTFDNDDEYPSQQFTTIETQQIEC